MIIPLRFLQKCMVVEQKKEEKRNVDINSYDCTPPDSVGYMGAMGCFVSYLATTMTLPRSPILIPQLSYKIKNFMFYDRQDNESGRARVPHLTRAD
jgi:hypothetical protein